MEFISKFSILTTAIITLITQSDTLKSVMMIKIFGAFMNIFLKISHAYYLLATSKYNISTDFTIPSIEHGRKEDVMTLVIIGLPSPPLLHDLWLIKMTLLNTGQ